MKSAWRRLKEAEPGHRFKREHEHHRGGKRGRSARIFSVALGLLIVAIGIVGLPAPGPGTLVIALGGALLARESHAVARAMDWAEVQLRRVLHWARSAWKHAAPLAKALMVFVGLGLAGLAGYLAYLQFFS
ncbi:MAG TPA: PGPGW domain-containing protein [Gemmatimonadales bacterium]|nr:PGPGW domain-containing protein [Gemmatimonadales bacterium]